MKFGFITCVQLGLRSMEAFYQSGGKLEFAVTLPDHIAKNKSGRVYIDDFCNQNDIPLFKYESINNKTLIETIIKKDIDWLFVIGWSQIASKDFLNSTKKGIIGIHPTLLPEGRGRASIPWAILKNLDRTGVTMFKMDESVDAGPIFDKIEIPLDGKTNATKLYDLVVDAHFKLIRKNTKNLLNNKFKLTVQDNSKASIWPGRKPEDGEINLEGSIYDAEKLIRAVTHPYPGAFYFHKGIKHIVWSARVLKKYDNDIKNSNTIKFNDGVLLILN
tara:strand:- start:2059 stop:2880 length:822 start_codon:yes stop_codon:yes gene_type:complete